MKKSAYIFNDGELKRKDNTVFFENEEGKKYLPIEDINEVYIFGEVTVTKKFLELATQKEILLHFFNYHEYYTGSYYPREHYNSGYMILKQAEYYLDEEKRRYIANAIIDGSVKNILTVLKYYNNRGKPLSNIIQNIEELRSRLNDKIGINQMMAIEGNIRDMYYGGFDIILDDADFLFERRTKQPPLNRLNALISFGNSLLYTIVLSEIYKTHLDPRIGFLHTTNNRRFTLNLDIAEIFKPILVDRTIFTVVAKKMLNQKHFEKKVGGIVLNDEGKKIFINQLNDKLDSTLNYKPLGRSVSYRRLIRLELYKLEKHLIGEKLYEPYVSLW
ncbi:MAG: type I-B CRISPR-associated endonuclease Cas1 [Clostridiaceae bacterium]|nr:type I-B CRISPR-associated endonuclease Cas1 [Clostridiaceae bacterium]